MRKTLKRTLALLLAVLMLCSGMMTAFAREPVETGADTSEVGVASGQGMGTLLKGLLEEQEDAEGEICFISSVSMLDRTATVELTAGKACTLVVAVYDETTQEMLGSGVSAVEEGQTEATVEIQALSLPETYLVKGFLLDENNKAVGRHFVTMEYTQAYQTFLETKPENFDSEDTIYFDETEKEENFGVLTDDVISGTVNAAMTWTYDAGTSTYIFANATAQVKALKAGDIFYYEYGDSGSEFLLFKVKTITVSGSTVTIAEDEDITLEEAFRFIRIEHGINEGSGFIDESQLPESLQKEERVNAQTEILNNDGKITLSDSLSLNYKSSDNGGVSISGKVGVEFTAAAKLYYDMRWGKDYYEFKLEFSFKFNFTVSVTGKIQVRKDNFYFPLMDIPIGPFVLEGKAYPAISFSVKIDAFKVEYTSSFKLYVSSESGGPQANTDSSKKWETDFGNAKIELKIGVGCEFGVSLAKLVEVGFDVEAGVKVVGDPSIVGIHNDLHHDCDVCFSCEARMYAEGAIFVKIKLFVDSLSLRWDAIKLSYDQSKALTKFYISVKDRVLYADSGDCPRKMLAVKFKIVDEAGAPIANAAVSSATGVCDINGDGVFEAKEIKTAANGMATIWFRGGKHNVTVRANGYEDKTQQVEVAELGKIVTIHMGSGSGSGVTPGGDNDFDGDLADCNVGDVINFGSYPQTEVTDSTTRLKLEAKSQNAEWSAYPYYSSGKQTDFMYYLDLQFGSYYYRGVRIEQYRPCCAGFSSSAANSYQDDNGYTQYVTYWFRYEPLQWRVLNPYTGFVLSESIIDAQDFHYTDSNHANGKYANNWAESSVRRWLNTTFMNDAFNGTEQQKIRTTTLDTPCPIEGYSRYDAGKTQDKVFLLSWYDVLSPDYGFNKNTGSLSARQASGTDYAKCQGLYECSSNKCSDWWLRSAGDGSNLACNVSYFGWVNDYGCGVDGTNFGIRPALQLNLGSGISKSPKKAAVQRAAETGETRTVQKGMRYTATQSGAVAGREYVLLVRQAGTTGLAAGDLYYIDQQTADSGTVTFAYVPRISGECTVEIFGDFAQPTSYTVTVTVKAETGRGSVVTGAGVYNVGDTVTLTATAASGEFFDCWYVNGEQVDADNPYTFTAAEDVSVRAVFLDYTIGSVSLEDCTVAAKKTAQLMPVVDPNEVDCTLTYTSSDPTIASVDQNGVVTAHKAGQTTITVTAADKYGNTKEAECTVTVKYLWWQILIRIFLFGFIWY